MNDRAKFADPQVESLLPPVELTRRGFLASGVFSGFALAAGPVMAQTAIKTSADGLDAADITVPTSDGKQMPAYYAMPAKGGKHHVVVVVPEVFGLHEYQKDICRRLAHVGYYAITLDPFFRQGVLAQMTEMKDVMAAANSLDDKTMLSDMDSLVDYIEKQPKADSKHMGITGMCRGGRTVWMTVAHTKKFTTGVAWYGGLTPAPPVITATPFDVVDQLNAPVLGLYGGADAGMPQPMIEDMAAKLKASPDKAAKASTIHIYPGMPHAFHADYRPSYRKEAAEDGWKRMLAWFKQHGV